MPGVLACHRRARRPAAAPLSWRDRRAGLLQGPGLGSGRRIGRGLLLMPDNGITISCPANPERFAGVNPENHGAAGACRQAAGSQAPKAIPCLPSISPDIRVPRIIHVLL